MGIHRLRIHFWGNALQWIDYSAAQIPKLIVEVGLSQPIFLFLTDQEEELIIPAVALVVKEQNLNVFNSVLRILNEMHDRIFFMRR